MLFRSPDLLPCPQCGDENAAIEDTDDGKVSVMCLECDYEGRYEETDTLAIAAWNAAARGAGVDQ